MIPKINGKQRRLEIGERAFIQALEIEQTESEIVLHPSVNRYGEILYAIPGGGVATEFDIMEKLQC